jgi:hypothetical protein
MDCSQYQSSLSAYIDGEAKNAPQIADHLGHCDDCKDRLAILSQPGVLLRHALHPSPQLLDQITDLVPAAPSGDSRPKAMTASRIPIWQWALAATLLLAATGTFWIVSESTNTDQVTPPPGARAWISQGRIKLNRAGQITTISPGAALEAGDRLVIQRAVELTLSTGAVLALNTGTKIEILDSHQLQLEAGRAHCDSRFSTDSLHIETALGSVDQTRVALFHVELLGLGEERTLMVSVDAGEVRVQTLDKKSSLIKSGQYLLANSTGVLTFIAQAVPRSNLLIQLDAARGRIQELEIALKEASEKAKKGPPLKKKSKLQKRPNGMTDEEIDSNVQALVKAHSWELTAQALRAKNKSNSRSLSMEEKLALKDFFGLLEKLEKLGISFFDRRVAKAFVPAWINSLGVDLRADQVSALSGFLEDSEKVLPPQWNRPLRYSESQIANLCWTLILEQELNRLLTPEQLNEYLKNVGDNPYDSALALKVKRINCPGSDFSKQVSQVTKIWNQAFNIADKEQALVQSIASQFVAEVNEIKEPESNSTKFQRREIILRRAIKCLEYQGEAEWELLRGLSAESTKPEEILNQQCSVIEFVR